jgi:chemotaxis protein methyltransferase CheR
MTAAATLPALSELHFRRIADFAAREAGIAIPETKKSLVQSRIGRRMRALGLTDYDLYLGRLDIEPAERSELVSVLTTNVSHFYRERHHFDTVREQVLSGGAPRRLRLWSAGCSNGQEPYTLAMEILKAIPDAAKRDILILASDIDAAVLARAAAGIYSDAELQGVPPAERARFFQPAETGGFAVRPEVKALVRFRRLNLNGDWPMRGAFEAIFCRNVVIYFSDETQQTLWPRFRDRLTTGGLLMLGHSERIHPLSGSGFMTAGVTTYRRV